MKKLENIQQNKLISSYGGVGSIIETNTNGALIIEPMTNGHVSAMKSGKMPALL